MDRESQTVVIDRWKRAFGQYDLLRAMAEPEAIRWEWTAGERYNPLPFYFQRYPARARALKAPPTFRGQHDQYGLDVQDRPRVHRLYAYHDEAFETFYTYTQELTEWIQFSIPPRIPLDVQQAFHHDGRVVHYARFRLNGYTPLYSQKAGNPQALYDWLGPDNRILILEDYVYDEERLARILTYGESPGAGAYQVEEHLTYDDAGKLVRIDRLSPDGHRHLVYRRRGKGETFASIRRAATEALIEAIADTLRAAEISEPLYCVELSYLSGIQHFPPSIIPGPESRREELLASGDPEARNSLFIQVFRDPATWLEITDREVLEVCARLEQEVAAGERWSTATRILRDVAAALTARDWTGILDVTPDFVVYAIDHEMEAGQLEQVLRASVPASQIRAWKRKGIL